jgi:asparagine synthase (glutamine-hydrolysing)
MEGQEAQAVLKRMTDAIRHRGPDDEGWWQDATSGVGLGNRRLAVLDVSALGHQPMVSTSGRYVIAYNGEVYNFKELRAELEQKGASFKTDTDTEVLLASFDTWGVRDAVERFNGMFAFALFDRSESMLFLCRDRLGIKPLYYGWVNGALVFASECHCIRAFPGFEGDLDLGAVGLYLRHNYIPAPYAIYRNIRKLMPGHLLSIRCDAAEGARIDGEDAYWQLRSVASNPEPFAGNEDDALDALHALLKDAVGRRMLSDVPLGAFLSGGIDSSLIAALMQVQSERPVRTFSIGFHEEGYNEAEHAGRVAAHLGTDHTELYVTPAEVLDVIPLIPQIFDEPFSDSSQVPTYLLSKLTRREVTVALSGDGGDELFAGYDRYGVTTSIWKSAGRVPHVLRSATRTAIKSLPPRFYDAALGWTRERLPSFGGPSTIGDKAHKFADVLEFRSFSALYRRLVSLWAQPEQLLAGYEEAPTIFEDGALSADFPDLTSRMMFIDLVTYLPDDILVKVDRASMAVSLEARVPLLDHRVVEFACQLPMSMKVKGTTMKWALKQLLYRHVPSELVERPKMGFGMPIDSWLRGPLRDWAESLIDESRLRREGIFDPAPIRRKMDAHTSGERNWHYHLWDILVFQAWLEHQSL